MKKTILNVFIAFMVLSVVACHKDNGNYDYSTELGAITISEEMNRNVNDPTKSPFVFKVGHPIVIPAKYEINDPSLTEDNVLIEWILGDVVVCTGKELFLENLSAHNAYSGLLVITDLRYGTKYSSIFSFDVEDIYSNAWTILSEKDGKSILSYLEIDPNTGDYVLVEDAYAKSNDGNSLASGVTAMTYHMYETSPYIWSLALVQPGDAGVIDLNANNMGVIGNFSNEFVTPLEGDAQIVDVAFASGDNKSVYLLTDDGKLYGRSEAIYDNSVVPHASLFPSAPISIEDGLQITDWINTSRISSMGMMVGLHEIIAYDAKNSRSVFTANLKAVPFDERLYTNTPEPNRNGPGTDGTNTYPDITFPGPEDLSGYQVIGMYGVGYDIDWMADPALSVVMLLKSDTDGKYYFFTYRFFVSWGSYDIDLDLFFPVPETISIDENRFVGIDNIGGPTSILYFLANDNKEIWYLDAITGACGKVFTSDTEITAIGLGEVQNCMAAMWMGDYTPYYEKMVVATVDGTIKVLQMDAAARATGKAEVLYSSNTDIGTGRIITYMQNVTVSI